MNILPISPTSLAMGSQQSSSATSKNNSVDFATMFARMMDNDKKNPGSNGLTGVGPKP